MGCESSRRRSGPRTSSCRGRCDGGGPRESAGWGQRVPPETEQSLGPPDLSRGAPGCPRWPERPFLRIPTGPAGGAPVSAPARRSPPRVVRPPSASPARERCLLAAAGWMRDPGPGAEGRAGGRASTARRPRRSREPGPKGGRASPSLPRQPAPLERASERGGSPPPPSPAVGLTFQPSGLAPLCSPRLPARPLGERERRRHRGGREADREAQPSCPRPAGWQAGSGLTLVDARAAGRPQPGTSPRAPPGISREGRQAGRLSPPASPPRPPPLRGSSGASSAGSSAQEPAALARGRRRRDGRAGEAPRAAARPAADAAPRLWARPS